MSLPAQTFTSITQLITYINAFIVPNASQQIDATDVNNVENALANFIVKYALNGSLATIVSNSGVVSLPTPVTVISTPAPSAITWPDNVQNEYYIVNATGTEIPFVSGLFYVDQFSIQQTSIPAHTVIQIAKATNGNWIQVSNLPGTLLQADAQTILGRYANTAGPLQEIIVGSGLVLDPATGILSVSSASAPFHPIAGTNISLSGSYPDITFSVTNNSISFTTGTTGSDINWSAPTGSLGGAIRLNIPNASGTNRGLLTNTDFLNFNSKQSALTFSTGITNTGGTVTADLSTGKAGGQSVIGGTQAGQSLTLSSTSNGTKGMLIFGSSVYDEVNNRLGIGQATPASMLDITHNDLLDTVPDDGGLLLANNSAGTSGAVAQNSPEIRLRGNEWDATDAINRTVDWRIYSKQGPGNSGISSSLIWETSDNGDTYVPQMIFAVSGVNATVSFSGSVSAGFFHVGDTVTWGSVNLSGVFDFDMLTLYGNVPQGMRIYNVTSGVDADWADLSFRTHAGVFTISTGAIGVNTAKNIQIGNQLGISVTPSDTAYMILAPGTVTIAPLVLTSGTNNTTAQTGAIEYDGTNLFFTRTGTTREVVLTGNSGAGAPTLNATPVFTHYYGGNTNELGDPSSWLSFVDGGTTYKIPLYT